MPIYEYRCKKCGTTFEKMHRITEEAPVTCLNCGEKAEKLFSPNIGIIFKGHGFYTTDYKGEERRKKEKEEED